MPQVSTIGNADCPVLTPMTPGLVYPELSRNLLGAWCPSLGNTGDKLLDRSGRSKHGVLTGMTIATAWVRSASLLAMLFSGASQLVSTGINSELNGIVKCTLAFWFRRTSVGSVIEIGRTSGLTCSMTVEIYSDGNVYLAPASATNFGSFVSNDTNWHHLVMVFNGDATGNTGRLRAYLDGMEKSLSYNATIGTALPTFSAAYEIGHAFEYSNGNFDDVSLYLRAWTPIDVAVSYSVGRAGAYQTRERRSLYAAASGRLLQLRRMCA